MANLSVRLDHSFLARPDPVVTIPAGTVVPAGGVFVLNENGTAPGAYPTFYTGYNISWNNDATGNPVALLLRNSSGQIVDFFAAYDATVSSITSPMAIPTNQWSGSGVTANTNESLSYSRIGNFDNNNASDWTIGNMTEGAMNPGLTVPFTGGTTPISITPTNITFVNGVWTGNVTVNQAATAMHFNVNDGLGQQGNSSSFNVALQSIALNLPTDVREGDGVVNASLTVSPAPSSDLQVTLSSSDPSRLSVPTTVTVLAGQTTAVFAVTVIDDTLLNGLELVNVNASAPAYVSTSSPVNVHDNESATLSVSLPSNAKEGDGSVTATITSSAAPSQNITVNLSSSNPSRATVPATVTLLAGQTTASFNVSIVDDTLIDGTAAVAIGASVEKLDKRFADDQYRR